MRSLLLATVLLLAAVGCDMFDEEIVFDGVSIHDDDNNDGRLSPGESARLGVAVSGYSDGASVRGTLSTDAATVTVSREDSYFQSGGSGTLTGTFSVDVAAGAQVGSDASFTVALRASSANSDDRNDSVAFALPIEATGAQPEIAQVEVTNADNGDAVANKGETVRLKVHLHNGGTSDLPGCAGVLVSSDAHVDVTHDKVTFGDVEQGETETGYHTYTIEVDDGAPAGHQAALTLQVTDSLDSSWSLPVPLTIVATGAQIVFSRYEVSDDDDDDGLVESGEDIHLKVYLKNAGTSEALGVDAVLSTNDPLLEIGDGSQERSVGDIDVGEERSAYQAYRLAVSPDTAPGHTFDLFLTITDDQANSWTDRFTLTEGASTIDLAIESTNVSEVGGDGNGRLAPGEVGRLEVVVRNRGTEAGREVQAELSTEDRNVRLDDARVRVGNVGPGGTAPAEGAFQFTVLASHPGGTVPFTLTLTAGNYRAERPLEVEVVAR